MWQYNKSTTKGVVGGCDDIIDTVIVRTTRPRHYLSQPLREFRLKPFGHLCFLLCRVRHSTNLAVFLFDITYMFGQTINLSCFNVIFAQHVASTCQVSFNAFGLTNLDITDAEDWSTMTLTRECSIMVLGNMVVWCWVTVCFVRLPIQVHNQFSFFFGKCKFWVRKGTISRESNRKSWIFEGDAVDCHHTTRDFCNTTCIEINKFKCKRRHDSMLVLRQESVGNSRKCS